MATALTHAPRIDAETVGWGQEAAVVLHDCFGVEFDLWVGPTPWVPLRAALSQAGSVSEFHEPHQRVSRLLAQHVNGGRDPLALDTSADSYLLVVPLKHPNRPVVAAVAPFAKPGRPIDGADGLHGSLCQDAVSDVAGPALPCCDPALVLRMARSVVESLLLKQKWSTTRLELDNYVEQISQAYEELSLWHNVSKCLESSDDHWQVAHTVLPWLQPLIHSDALVLLTARMREGQAEDALPADVGSAKLWIGGREVGEDVCCRLVEKFQDRAVPGPLVKNQVAGRFPGVESFVLVRLARSDAVLGWLVALNRADGGEFGTREASLMSSTAAILTSHGHNTQLFREKESLLVGVVRALVSAIDAKDPNTRGHSERVGLIAQRLGRELGLAEPACEQLYLTGMLHDIGKIGVSDRVLRKRGKLTSAEFDEIKRHVEIGYAILKDLPQVGYALSGVRHHHERYNGEGYPDGLPGESIPLVARIVAVADAYDAMSSQRPYREAVAQMKVEEILMRGANQQWDGRVVEAFFHALPEIRLLREEHGVGGSPRGEVAEARAENENHNARR